MDFFTDKFFDELPSTFHFTTFKHKGSEIRLSEVHHPLRHPVFRSIMADYCHFLTRGWPNNEVMECFFQFRRNVLNCQSGITFPPDNMFSRANAIAVEFEVNDQLRTKAAGKFSNFPYPPCLGALNYAAASEVHRDVMAQIGNLAASDDDTPYYLTRNIRGAAEMLFRGQIMQPRDSSVAHESPRAVVGNYLAKAAYSLYATPRGT